MSQEHLIAAMQRWIEKPKARGDVALANNGAMATSFDADPWTEDRYA